MIEINKEKLKMWAEVETAAGWGGLAKITKLSGLSSPTVLRALRDGRATHKTIIKIDKAVSRVRKQVGSVIKM